MLLSVGLFPPKITIKIGFCYKRVPQKWGSLEMRPDIQQRLTEQKNFYILFFPSCFFEWLWHYHGQVIPYCSLQHYCNTTATLCNTTATHCNTLHCSCTIYASRLPPFTRFLPHFFCVLQCVVVCCSALQCVAVCCSVCCSVLQCVAVCCRVLHCVAVRCSTL